MQAGGKPAAAFAMVYIFFAEKGRVVENVGFYTRTNRQQMKISSDSMIHCPCITLLEVCAVQCTPSGSKIIEDPYPTFIKAS